MGRLLNRRLARASRPGRPIRRFSLAPITAGLAALGGVILLTEILPRVWDVTLPGGLRQADFFRGWAALLWRSAILTFRHRMSVAAVIGLAVLIGLPLASRSGGVRWAFRLLAFILVLADFGILLGMMAAAVSASGLAQA